MTTLKQLNARPRVERNRPSYPRAIGFGIVALLAACGGSVDRPDETGAGAGTNVAGAGGVGGDVSQGAYGAWGGGPSGAAPGGFGGGVEVGGGGAGGADSGGGAGGAPSAS